MSSSQKHYLVIECTSCKRLILAVSKNETRTCPYCGKRVRLENARVVVRSQSAEDARAVLQDLKARKHQGDSNGFR